MKSKLLLLILFVWEISFGQKVPNTTTFTLQNVVDVVNPTTDDLSDAFTDSNAAYFNATYGSKTMSPKTLYGFRDYGPSAPTYSLAAAQDFSGGSSTYFTDALMIGTPVGRYDSFGINYSGTSTTSWKTLVVTAFTADYDGDGYALWSIILTGEGTPSYPQSVTVTGIPNATSGTFTVIYSDPSGTHRAAGQRCRITYYIIDSNDQQGASATLTIGAI